MTLHAGKMFCILLALGLTPGGALAEPEGDRLRSIPWNSAPDYIQTQVRNIVMSCTEGSLTFDRAKILRYDMPEHPKTHHYVIDFSAWRGQPLRASCSYGQLCDKDGCLLAAYTQVGKDVWDLATRQNVVSWRVTEEPETDESLAYPVLEMQLRGDACRVTGADPCQSGFTWHGNRFSYLGFGAVVPPGEDPFLEGTEE